MPILVDGHNLIGRLPDIRLDDEHDEARLVSRLQAYASRTGKRVAVVFDRGLPGGVSRELSRGRIEVVFAPTSSSADRVLRQRIRNERNPQGLIVVTSDREVIAAAEERGARVVRSEAFVDELNGATASEGDKASEVGLGPEEMDEWLELFGE